MKKYLKHLGLGFIAFIILAIIAVASGDTTNTTTSENKKERSAEQNLAVIDNINDTTNIKAIRIKILVDELATKYSEPKDTIAEYTYRAQSVLHDKGIEETCLGVLEGMHKVNKVDNVPYKDAVILYTMIRANQ
jgi:predicted metal-dependent phosphoesterase TrpH